MPAQNREGTAPKVRGRPFQSGNCANPGGRPKKEPELAAKIREMDDELRARLEHIALHGAHKDSVPAIKLLWSYAHGLPRQVVTDVDGNAVHLGVVILPEKKLLGK